MNGLTGKIIHAKFGSAGQHNEFAYVVKETPQTLQVLVLERERVSGDSQIGSERPIIPSALALANAKKNAIRVNKKPDNDGGIMLWGHDLLWIEWDGEPKSYFID